MNDVWAAVPVKEFTGAKQRLAALLTAAQRETLAATMLEDVLAALAGATRLAGIMVNTVDPRATDLAERYGARVVTEGARDGHTGAVNGMARMLAAEGHALLTMPGDIPRVTSAEIDAVVASRRPAPSFTIVPAHDELGSNAVLCDPPGRGAVAVRRRQLFSASCPRRAARGIEPTIVRLPGIGLDIDHPEDLRAFLRATPRRATRTLALLEAFGV